ncbi:aldo/keto reductase [Nostoc sp. 3335mG]|nr:aldo/keto reductase [Nostoc sp. 3335mG]
MKLHQLGKTGPQASAIGLGCMGMSGSYGASDRSQAIDAIHQALDAGITLLDTGDFYGMGHNERLLAEALKGRPRDSYQLSVKFGALRGPDGSWLGFDGRPEAVKSSLAYTLDRLGTDHVDVYRPGRLDPTVPIEETVGAIKEMIEAGYVRNVGLSEVGSETIRRAAAVHPVADLQIEYSVITRGIEDDILATCRELGIAITAYGVLSRGLLSGYFGKEPAKQGDFRAHSPRFEKGNVEANLALVEKLRAIADAKGATVAQIAIAWVMSRGDDIVPIIGARRPDHVSGALGALDVTLDAADLDAIEQAVPKGAAQGDRYPAFAMASLDSER